MEEIYKNVLLLIHSLTQLSGTTYMFKEEPSEAKAEKIVEVVDKCENKFLKVKEEIIKMIQEVERSQKIDDSEDVQEVKAIKTDNGFLIKE